MVSIDKCMDCKRVWFTFSTTYITIGVLRLFDNKNVCIAQNMKEHLSIFGKDLS